MKENVRIFKDFTTKFGINVWFRQGGYLIIAHTEEQLSYINANIKLQNKLGVKTKLIKRENP